MKFLLIPLTSFMIFPAHSADLIREQEDSLTEASTDCDDCSIYGSASGLQKIPKDKISPASTTSKKHEKQMSAASFNWSGVLSAGMGLLGSYLNYRASNKYLSAQTQFYSNFNQPYLIGGYGTSTPYLLNGAYSGYSSYNTPYLINNYNTSVYNRPYILGNTYTYNQSYLYNGYSGLYNGYGAYTPYSLSFINSYR